MSRSEMVISTVDLSGMARQIFTTLSQAAPDRRATLSVADEGTIQAYSHLMQILLDNLIGNAWKYTRNKELAVIEFGCTERDGERVFFVRDNGTGFNMAYADKLFGPVQRFHKEEEFEGTGIGLTTVERVIQRHGGRIWADAKPSEGATFFSPCRAVFRTLPQKISLLLILCFGVAASTTSPTKPSDLIGENPLRVLGPDVQHQVQRANRPVICGR
jgi:light-regulated signal transduction histidine kinase (bacteriophytochrome)